MAIIAKASQPDARPMDLGPRPDLSAVNPELADAYVLRIADILSQDVDEDVIAGQLRALDAEMNRQAELAIVVFDQLAIRKIASKAVYRAWINWRPACESY